MIPDWKFYGPGRVYFLESGDFIKIGFSEMLKRRLYLIRANNAVAPVLLLAVPGSRDYEDYIQSEFRHLRDHQDWFRVAPELTKYIEDLLVEHIRNRAPIQTERYEAILLESLAPTV